MPDTPSPQEQIEQIRKLLALPDLDAQFRATLEAELQHLIARTHPTGAPVVTAPTSRRDTNIATNQTIHNYAAADNPDQDTLLREYLRGLAGDCNRLSLADADSSDPTRAAVELAAVYTRLEVASTVEIREAERRTSPGMERQRQQTALEMLATHPRLVLLGSPGSGKSTVANFVGLCLAQARLGATAWLERLEPAWPHGALLPIRVILREFAAWVDTHTAPDDPGDARLLWTYLEQQERPELVARLRQEVADGRALLLLDGLDEVPTNEQGQPLTRVRQTLEALTHVAGSSRLLVTCRILDYQQPARQLPGWPTATLIPFADDLRQTFIARWYDVLARLDRPLNGDPDVLRDRLQGAVRDRPELRRLAGNPLLLTMMTLLHAYEGRLPEERVKLYAKCVEFLLHRWRPQPGEPPLGQRLGIGSWSESDLGRLLDRLGFVAHTRGVSSDGETGADLPRPLLIETARAFFAPYGADQDYTRAQTFCTSISRHSNGILQQHSQAIYRFPHRTFQEFLAARRLVADDEWDEAEAEFVPRALQRIDAGPQWREALLLAVSQQVVVNNQVTPAALLAEELLERHPEGSAAWAADVVLAGEVLAEVGRDRLAGLRPRRARIGDQGATALARVLALVDPTGRPLLPVADRVRAGIALGRLGDPRPGVCDLKLDWCEVPAGSFLLGSSDQDEQARDREKPQRTVELPGFRISRYPVTHAQWQRFMDAGGYQERRWWSAAGWQANEEEDWTQPGFWDNPRFNGANQPVVGISWYEANAFCHWLSDTLGYAVRLPSEAEWEKAARGSDGRIYPWGNDWDANRANTDEGGIGATTPVGCYPDGAGSTGALDLSGNVLEWTATPWTNSYEQSDGTACETEDGEAFVWRGGAWSTHQRNARCASRYDLHPSYHNYSLGLRVCAAHVGSDE